MLSTTFKSLAAKLIAVAVLALGATGALAATDNLPEPAQGAVKTAFSHVGVHVHGDSSTEGENGDAEPQDAPEQANNEHGQEVSDAAHATYDSGRDKGAAVSDIASQNGQDHRSENADPGANKPDDVPASGPDDHPTPDDHPGGNPNGQPAGNPTEHGQP